MAEVRWIKLVTDMFNNRKIKQIKKLPEGDAIIVIWLQILCLAGQTNDNGMVYFSKDIPYTDEMLAVEFDRSIGLIRLALATFEKFNMIEIIDDILLISNWEKYQSADKLQQIREKTRKRVANYRSRQIEMLNGVPCQYCGGKSTGYDHIIATARGGINDESNKIPCCLECNRIKNDKPLVDFLNSNRDRIDDKLVTSNTKLKAHVFLCNVTDRYKVTQGNAIELELDIDKELDKDKDKRKKIVLDLSPLEKTINDFIDFRKGIKAKMSDRAVELLRNKLDKLANNDEDKIKILEQSIINGWKSVYELKGESNGPYTTSTNKYNQNEGLAERAGVTSL